MPKTFEFGSLNSSYNQPESLMREVWWTTCWNSGSTNNIFKDQRSTKWTFNTNQYYIDKSSMFYIRILIHVWCQKIALRNLLLRWRSSCRWAPVCRNNHWPSNLAVLELFFGPGFGLPGRRFGWRAEPLPSMVWSNALASWPSNISEIRLATLWPRWSATLSTMPATSSIQPFNVGVSNNNLTHVHVLQPKMMVNIFTNMCHSSWFHRTSILSQAHLVRNTQLLMYWSIWYLNDSHWNIPHCPMYLMISHVASQSSNLKFEFPKSVGDVKEVKTVPFLVQVTFFPLSSWDLMVKSKATLGIIRVQMNPQLMYIGFIANDIGFWQYWSILGMHKSCFSQFNKPQKTGF